MNKSRVMETWRGINAPEKDKAQLRRGSIVHRREIKTTTKMFQYIMLNVDYYFLNDCI